MTKKDKGLIKFIIILTLIIFIPFGIFVWYSQTIDETLTCDKDYKCKVVTTRFFNIKTTKEFNINKQSDLEIKYSYKPHGPKSQSILVPTGYRFFVYINSNKIFNNPICSTSEYNYNYEAVCKPFIDSAMLSFEKYQQGFIQNFVMKSEAKTKNKFWFCTIFCIFLWLLLVFGIIYTESDFLKEYKKRLKHKKLQEKIAEKNK